MKNNILCIYSSRRWYDYDSDEDPKRHDIHTQ